MVAEGLGLPAPEVGEPGAAPLAADDAAETGDGVAVTHERHPHGTAPVALADRSVGVVAIVPPGPVRPRAESNLPTRRGDEQRPTMSR